MNVKDTVELAAQIVFEYPGWGDEHVGAMLDTYEDESAPCTYDELMNACGWISEAKKLGHNYNDSIGYAMTWIDVVQRRKSDALKSR